MNHLVLKYAALTGKYVRFERPRAQEEYDYKDDSPTVGGEGVVAKVFDGRPRLGGQCVEIVFDYGMGVTIVESDEAEWSLTVFSDEEQAVIFGEAPMPRADYIERRRKERIERAAEAMSDSLLMLGVNPNETYEGDWRACAQILADIALKGAGQ